MNAEAIGGERIAVEDESCDLRLGVVLKMKAFAGGFVGSLSWKRDLAVLAGVHPTLRKMREGWGTRRIGVVLKMKAFCRWVCGFVELEAGFGGAGGVHPTLRKMREGWGTRRLGVVLKMKAFAGGLWVR
jgi:hypothetical protein